MRHIYLLVAASLLTCLLLLCGCTKHDAITTLEPSEVVVNDENNLSSKIPAWQAAYSALPDEKQLTVKLSARAAHASASRSAPIIWRPNWSKPFPRPGAAIGSNDVFIPMQAPEIQWIGVKKYLLVQEYSGRVIFNLITYLYTEKANTNSDANGNEAFFKNFTGTMIVKNMHSSTTYSVYYENGLIVQKVSNKTKKALGNSRTRGTNDTNCYTKVYCRWDGYCTLTDQGYAHYGTETNGIDYCDEPASDGVGCSQIQWDLTESSAQTFCDNNPDNPNNPPNNGGGDSDNATSNATYEEVELSNLYTAAPTPPDATQYNCNELKNKHPDDPGQAGYPGNIDLFVHNNQGYFREQIIGQRGYQHIAAGITMSMGPYMRYIEDPLNPSVIIDLRHMLTVGYYGSTFGNSVEVIEGLGGHPGSYDSQDYFSNQLGYDFYRNYKSRIDAYPSYFAYFLSDFLKDVNMRTQNTNPATIKAHCP